LALFGTAWMRAEGLTDEELKKGNMALIFGLTSLLSFIAIVIFLKIDRYAVITNR
jgi:hypothetical protein